MVSISPDLSPFLALQVLSHNKRREEHQATERSDSSVFISYQSTSELRSAAQFFLRSASLINCSSPNSRSFLGWFEGGVFAHGPNSFEQQIADSNCAIHIAFNILFPEKQDLMKCLHVEFAVQNTMLPENQDVSYTRPPSAVRNAPRLFSPPAGSYNVYVQNALSSKSFKKL